MSGAGPNGLQFAFAEGGYTGPGGKYDAAGIVHRGEIVWSQAHIARAGGVAAVAAMRLGANDNRLAAMPFPLLVMGGGMDVGALLSELQALRAEVRTLRTENKAGHEMQARVTKAGADKVAGKFEETTDEVAGSREDARRDAGPKRAGRGEPVRSAA